jgi:diguanylate cyclase (GGDEF)-like protein
VARVKTRWRSVDTNFVQALGTILDYPLRQPPTRRSLVLATLGGLALVTAIAIGEYFIGAGASLALLYLLPVAGVAWCSGSPTCSLLVAAAASVTIPLVAWLDERAHRTALLVHWDGIARFLLLVAFICLILQIRRLLRDQQSKATSDALTGLANISSFRAACEMEIERARRFGHVFSIAYIDLDDFKAVNDAAGHAAGDAALRTVAVLLRRSVRTLDTAARIGGDEFAILLPETDLQAADVPLRRLMEHMPKLLPRPGGQGGMTCSIGLAAFASPPVSAEAAIETADAFMYEAKAAGKNRLVAVTVETPAAILPG